MQPSNGLFEQLDVDMLPIQALVVIKSFGIDESCVTFPILGDNFLTMVSINRAQRSVSVACARASEIVSFDETAIGLIPSKHFE